MRREEWEEKEKEIQRLEKKTENFQEEWEYKMRRDADGVQKQLDAQKTQFEQKLRFTTEQRRELQLKDKARWVH